MNLLEVAQRTAEDIVFPAALAAEGASVLPGRWWMH
jgi:hypothetical protein